MKSHIDTQLIAHRFGIGRTLLSALLLSSCLTACGPAEEGPTSVAEQNLSAYERDPTRTMDASADGNESTALPPMHNVPQEGGDL